jgi:hypothetical protein
MCMCVQCRKKLRARLVACKESNQAPGSRKPVDWIPGPSLRCVPHAAQSTSGAGPRETSESSVSQSHPPLELFRERDIRADAGGRDGASSGCVVKKRRENFGHRPLFWPLI